MKAIIKNTTLSLFFLTLLLLSCSKEKMPDPVAGQQLPPPPPPPLPPVAGANSCSSRPVKNATLIQVGSLSVPRLNVIAGAAGSKILFAGGWQPGINSSRVDVYDTITQNWSTAELTVPERDGMVVASVGEKILFAGGGNNDWIDVTSRVDIYNAATNTWSVAELSRARNYLSAITLGSKVFFGGGGVWGPLSPGSSANYHIGSDVVDIYDNQNNSWTTATLSEGRFELSATAVGKKIYFAGGLNSIFSISTKVDVFDTETNSWSTSQLLEPKTGHCGITIGNKIFWIGGAITPYWTGYLLSKQVEIRDLATNVSSFECANPKRFGNVAIKNDNILFFSGLNADAGNLFDIYNTTTNSWSLGVLPLSIVGAAVISVNNTIYIAGGSIGNNTSYSDKVWKLEF